MYRTRAVAVLLVLFLFIPLAPQARADKKEVSQTKEWKGSVDDADLAKDVPDYVADVKAFAKLWKKWGIEGKVPKVDFKNEIVIVSTTSGSRLSLSARLDDQGDLEVVGIATSDFGPGFRYAMETVPRKGVKTVNGKKLKTAKDRE
jgi:hypothetical protein